MLKTDLLSLGTQITSSALHDTAASTFQQLCHNNYTKTCLCTPWTTPFDNSCLLQMSLRNKAIYTGKIWWKFSQITTLTALTHIHCNKELVYPNRHAAECNNCNAKSKDRFWAYLYLWYRLRCFLGFTKVIQQTYKLHRYIIIVCRMKNSADSFQKLFCKLCVLPASL